MADGRVSSGELKRLLKTCDEVYGVLQAIHQQREQLTLDSTLAARLDIASWAEGLGEFDLPPADQNNINEWMQAIDSWINSYAGALSALRHAALEQLLSAEAQVAATLRQGATAAQAPTPSQAPGEYATLVPGSERELQKRLDLWDRFQTADGLAPALARLLVSGTIIGSALVFGAMV